MSDREDMVLWLEDAARYFEARDTHGEDQAHWANVFNAKMCRKIKDNLAARTGPDVAGFEALDLLQLQQRGRAKAIRLLNAQREITDMAELAQADAYERCGDELKATIAALPAPAGESVTVHMLARVIEPSASGYTREFHNAEMLAEKLLSTFTITRKSKNEEAGS